MTEIYPSPDHVAAFKISGTLTGGDYDCVIAEVETKLARHDRLGVLVDLVEFEDFTAEAGWKDAPEAQGPPPPSVPIRSAFSPGAGR
jgi:hypothetical protein